MKEINYQNTIRGYFGKVPAFNDFIKFNSGSSEILVLDQWLQEGIILAGQRLKNDWKIIYKNSLPLRFFYPFTGTDNFISGIIFPSRDKSNRDFPFLIFFNFSKHIFEEIPLYLEPLIFSNVFSSFEEIFNHININTLLNDLNESIYQIPAIPFKETIDEKYQEFIDSLSQRSFWQRICEDSNEGVEYRIINNIFSPEIKNSSLILEFSFASDKENNILDICFLLNIIMASRNNYFMPAIFWNKNISNKVSLYIFPSKPAPINYLDMIYSTENSGRIFKVDEQIESGYSFPLIKDLLDKKEMNLKELLQILNFQ